jgi:hypothetical protein
MIKVIFLIKMKKKMVMLKWALTIRVRFSFSGGKASKNELKNR